MLPGLDAVHQTTTKPEFLAIGHLSFDVHLDAEGNRSAPVPGGAVSYTALMASALGLSPVTVISAAADDYPRSLLGKLSAPAISPSPATTVFEDNYDLGYRQQRLLQKAEKLAPVDHADPHQRSRPKMLMVCPLLDEVPLDCRHWFEPEFSCLIPQGWFRTLDRTGLVGHREPDVSRIAGPWNVVVLSVDEARTASDQRPWREICDILVVTRGEQGAVVYQGERETAVPALQSADAIDTTGAGDSWAAAFCVRYRETGDVGESGKFAAAAAAICVSRRGLQGVPADRAEVLERMRV
jgi:sugar/nucleoside kinase (ribokinase family)